jgi:hypothetical protein
MKKTQKFRTLALVAGVSTLYGLCGAYAAVLPVTSTIKFMSDITFVSTSGPNFGYVKAATVATCVLSTAGVVTGCTSEGGTPAAGVYTIKGSGTGLINISANGYTLNGTSTPSLATCSYNSVAVGGGELHRDRSCCSGRCRITLAGWPHRCHDWRSRWHD